MSDGLGNKYRFDSKELEKAKWYGVDFDEEEKKNPGLAQETIKKILENAVRREREKQFTDPGDPRRQQKHFGGYEP